MNPGRAIPARPFIQGRTMDNSLENALPRLSMDVGLVGSEVQDSTVHGVCVAVGIIAGVFINTNTEQAIEG